MSEAEAKVKRRPLKKLSQDTNGFLPLLWSGYHGIPYYYIILETCIIMRLPLVYDPF